MSTTARMGILVGGGPAPAINSAISAATIEAVNSGLLVVGLLDGFKHLTAGRTDIMRALRISDVSRIHSQGGSILRTSRTNPARHDEDLRRTVDSIKELGIYYLVTIGGDDTTFGASEVAKAAGGRLKVAHVPKAIDNDLPLPGGMPAFGFETVRQVGTSAVLNLMEDARTTNRWYFVVVMGRTADHLALGITKPGGHFGVNSRGVSRGWAPFERGLHGLGRRHLEAACNGKRSWRRRDRGGYRRENGRRRIGQLAWCECGA